MSSSNRRKEYYDASQTDEGAAFVSPAGDATGRPARVRPLESGSGDPIPLRICGGAISAPWHAVLSARMPWLLLAIFLIGPVTEAAGVEFADSTFADADWQTTQFFTGPGTGGGTAIQDAAGNPGPSRRVTHTFFGPGANAIVVRHLLSAATHDPSVGGPIEGVSFSIDFMNVATFGAGQRFNLAVSQDGKFYIAVATGTALTGTAAGWHGHLSSVLDAEDFFEQNTDGSVTGDHPDFSANGAPITFGFSTSNNIGAGTLIVLYDNYSVFADAVPVPVPGLGVGGGAILVCLLSAIGLVAGSHGRQQLQTRRRESRFAVRAG
jgi:hypothetical protein